MNKCSVCKLGNSVGKYKCPSCFARYCSASCCTRHKENFCKPDAGVKRKRDDENSDRSESKISLRGVIPLEKMKSLGDEEKLKDLLRNPHLRELLKVVNNAKNPEEMMQKAMLEPLFVEFADVCLNKLNPDTEDG